MADTSDLCIVAFQPETFESAANFLRRMTGWTFEVYPTEGEMFTAALEDVVVDTDSGQYKAHLRLFNHDRPAPNGGGELKKLDIYDEIERMEVC